MLKVVYVLKHFVESVSLGVTKRNPLAIKEYRKSKNEAIENAPSSLCKERLGGWVWGCVIGGCRRRGVVPP